MSRSGGQSEARLPVFKSPSQLGTHLWTHWSRVERLRGPGMEPGPVVWKRDHWAYLFCAPKTLLRASSVPKRKSSPVLRT
ncbi:hypothetical protein TNCV_2902941 [Trichonephila clavipes]|nr:hypothetical protein TNCV_2902941 [Trichonephila clavipes]